MAHTWKDGDTRKSASDLRRQLVIDAVLLEMELYSRAAVSPQCDETHKPAGGEE